MPATHRPQLLSRIFFVATFFVAAMNLTALSQPPDPKKPNDPKSKDLQVVKLPDGTYLWVGNPADNNGERVSLTPQELQKLLDQVDQLKKQLAAKKTTAPSGCAVRGRVEKRGEQLVAAIKLTCTFRTTAPRSVVALGGRRAFLLSAVLDGNKLPVLDATEDGFSLLVETPGDHSITLDLEAPITSRGAKPELGFEIGLPRAAITTLLLEPPGPDVKRVNLTTRTVDPSQPARPPESRRTPALELKQLAPRAGQEAGYPLGPIDSIEITWDPPATTAQPADQVQSAELDVAVFLTEGVVETTAKIRFRGPGREWKLVAPANADLSVAHANGSDIGPVLPAVVTKPGDVNKPVWKIEIPAGSTASDWIVTTVTRQLRPKQDDRQHRGPFSIGPFTTLDVLRQTGMVRVTAGANTHFTFKHGPDLRKAEPTGPGEDDVTTAFFRLTTGPTGTTPVNSPLFTIEARAQSGAVKVKPVYRLTLTDAGWRIRGEVKVFPIRTEIDSVLVEVPADWRGLEASPPELVEGVQQGVSHDGFWEATAASIAGGRRVPVVVRLAARHKQPFDLVLTATVPIEPGDTSGIVPLPRFPEATESGASVIATVPEGFEVRGETRDWDGEYSAWGTPLTPDAEVNARSARAITTVSRKTDSGLSRVTLGWNPYHPDLSVETRADVTLGERQMVISQQIKLRSTAGLPRQVRLRGPSSPAALKATPFLDLVGPGEWVLTPPTQDSKEIVLSVSYAISLARLSSTDTDSIKIPVTLLLPMGATRMETIVRVWSDLETNRRITTFSTGWRELPVELAPDRDALPALTLLASGIEPLILETQLAADVGAVAVWADRGLVQAWGAEDGTVSYRARFVLRRWLRPSVEIRLPGTLAGPNPEFLRDGQRLEATLISSTEHERAFRVPLPPSRPGATTVIEVRYQLALPRARTGELIYSPPILPGVAFAGPVRWQATVPDGNSPFLMAGATPEFRWLLRPLGVAPCASGTGEALEAWFNSGDESTDNPDLTNEGFTARQMTPAPITVYQLPHTGVVIASSVLAFILVLFLWRLPSTLFGLGVGLFGASAVVTAVFFPHPAAQVVGSSQPGLAAAAVVVVFLSFARWLHRRRVTRMPGFSRSLPELSTPMTVLPSSARNRANTVGLPSLDPASRIEG